MQASRGPEEILEQPETGRATNYFDSPGAAARYAFHRPAGQDSLLALLPRHLPEKLPVGRALDVGCGTGNSTVALRPFAREVIGLDPSSFMLAQARRMDGVSYRKGHAEALPFGPGEFDLITVATAYHWFDQEAFLAEACRVLRPGGWLLLYKAGSTGSMPDNPRFGSWWQNVFRTRYPKVAQNHDPLDAARASQFGFAEIVHLTGERRREVELDDQVGNLLTHSSVIRRLHRRGETLPEERAWLHSGLAPFFPGGSALVTFRDWLHLWRRSEVP
jgi:ubiquinone/menaquinone biosynthesis C-methylase UbiE